MSVRIIAVTQPVISANDGGDIISVNEFIAYVARVSNPSNQSNTLTAPKLLKYLLKHKHFSPFEMAHVVAEITTTRDIGRQILRHRSFTFQEFSQRYADPTKDLGFVNREARLQDHKNRQNSVALNLDSSDVVIADEWYLSQERVKTLAIAEYNRAIALGIAKEQARSVLPEGLIQTRMYMAGSLRSWIHYIMVRADVATQLEHRTIAMEALTKLIEYFPCLEEIDFGVEKD